MYLRVRLFLGAMFFVGLLRVFCCSKKVITSFGVLYISQVGNSFFQFSMATLVPHPRTMTFAVLRCL